MRVSVASKLAFLCALCILSSDKTFGQTSQGSIAGTITDSSGALVAGANVVVRNTATGARSQTVSTTAGTYSVPNLSPGIYDVTATLAGFKAAKQSAVVVQVATTAALNITVQPGDVTETVTVTAGAPTIETETSDVGTVVTSKQVLELPLALGDTVQAMRSPEMFVFLTPGTVGPGTNGGGSNGATTGGPFQSKISGGQNYSTEILLDGASMYRSENGSSFSEAAPSVEALGEFRVETSTMPAELGRTTGGIEIFSTKAGTNQFHGNAYNIFRNEDLDANTFYNNFLGRPRALDKQNDYGGTLGGPVWIPKIYNGKDRTFFFFSWEQYRQTQGGSSTTAVPTAAEKAGDFTQTLDRSRIVGMNPCENNAPIYFGEIFNPATTQTINGVQCRTSYLTQTGKNAIPPSQFSSIGAKLLSYYPDPTTSSLVNNYTLAFSFPLLDTTMSFRIDQNLGQKDKIFFSYSSRDNNRLSTNPIFSNVAGSGRSQDFFTHYMRLGNDYTISPTMLDHLNLGFNRTNSKNVGAGVRLGNGQDWNQVLGIAGASGPTFPGVGAGESTITGFGDTVNNDTIDYGYRISNVLEWVKGKHNLKFGVDIRPQVYEPGVFNNTSGTVNFARAETAATVLTNGQSGNGIASMLLGLVDNGNLNAYASQARWRSNYYAVYGQDSFKVTPTLTVNYGLRWDLDIPRWEVHGNTSNISLTAPNPSAGGRPGALVFAGVGPGRTGKVDEKWANTFKKDFGPRLGFAWSPSALGGKTVVRGGYGIFYAALTYADFGADLQTGFQANPQFNSVNGFSPAFTLASGFPAYSKPPFLDPGQVNLQGNPANAYVDPSYGRPGMVQNWSFEIQHQLASDLILDVAYVGEHATHLRSNFDPINRLPTSTFGLGSLLNAPVSSPQAQAAGIGSPYPGFPTARPVSQALQPYPQYFVLNTDCCLENLGQSSFNALEISLRRRFRNGLNLLASYTYSKTMTDADSALPFFATLAGGGSAQNPFDLKNEKSVSNQDIPHNLVLSYIYELPVGTGKKFLNHGGVMNAVFGGWAISGIQVYHSGQPYAFCCATGPPTYGSVRFDRVLGQQIFTDAWLNGTYDPTSGQPFLNKNAFSDPNAPARIAAGGAYRFGTMGRTISQVRSVWYKSEDFNLLKRTRITEHSNLLLQVSFLDAFNRHIFDTRNAVDLNPNDGNFGILNPAATILGPRRIQLQLKYEF